MLAEPRFRVLFGTRSLAVAADMLRTVSLSVLVFSVSGSVLLAAVTYGISFAPQVLGGVLFGALADRIRPRLLIVGAYALEAVTGMFLGLVRTPVAVSLALVGLVACLTPIFAGASNRLVAEVLTGDAYVLGRSLTNIANSGAQLLGLAGGGVAVAALGARHALVLSAGVHAAAAFAVRLRLPDLPVPEAEDGRSEVSVVRQSWAANRRLLAERRIRTLLLMQWLPPALVTGAESLLVPYAALHHYPKVAPGLLLAALPVGMIVGEMAVGRALRPTMRERLVFPLLAWLGLPLLIFLGTPTFAVALAALAVAGVGFAYTLGIQRPFLAAIPKADLGAAFGLLSTGVMTLQGIGPMVFGGLSELIPVGAAISTSGACVLLTAAALGLLHRDG